MRKRSDQICARATACQLASDPRFVVFWRANEHSPHINVLTIAAIQDGIKDQHRQDARYWLQTVSPNPYKEYTKQCKQANERLLVLISDETFITRDEFGCSLTPFIQCVRVTVPRETPSCDVQLADLDRDSQMRLRALGVNVP